MLNKKQQEVVNTIHGPLMVLSVAGSGKTTTVINRMANLIKNNINPHNILGLTFSTKAAQEIRDRVASIIGPKGSYITTKTFHGFGYARLKEDGDKIGISKEFTLLTSEYSRTILVSDCIKAVGLDKKLNNKNDANDIKKMIDLAKLNLVYAGDFSKSSTNAYPYEKRDIAKIYIKYQEKMREKNCLDFGDLILHMIKLLDNQEILTKYQDRYQYIFIDEYQDTNKAQYMIMQKIATRFNNVCVVGDLDQRIYGFQGANPDAAKQFNKDFPNAQLIKMEQNYRSTPNILHAANALINNNSHRIPTTMWTTNESTNMVHFSQYMNETEEATTIINNILDVMKKKTDLKYKDFAILYRLNRLSKTFEKVLTDMKIPFVMGKKENHFYNQEEVKDVLSYLRVLNDFNDRESTINNMYLQRGIGKETIKKIDDCAKEHNITLVDAIKYNIVKDPKYLCKNITGQLDALASYYAGINYLIDFSQTHELDELINEIVDKSNYINEIKSSETEVNKARYENILELRNEVVLFVDKYRDAGFSCTLADYLTEVDSLMFDDDEEDKDGVILTTIHGAKGREFEYVYIVGFEDKILPYSAAINDLDDLEEERRLAYVAITRAKYQLSISCCETRKNLWTGKDERAIPSRFLMEIPDEFVQAI